ncbi:OmpW/AlkL family protein [Reyranella sp.]|uniref:OmpW/AlkL family protein n=1 Tax=Reyranella sp. TaxID=1929291 RepID=UPI0040356394
MACSFGQAAKADDTESQSPWQVRVRALGVLPASSGSTVNVQGVPALSTPNSSLSIGNSIVPEVDISYYITRNVAAELILGVTPHNITGSGALANLNIGKAWLLPPTLLAQYHFTDFGAFKPYIGIGLNYTIFFGQSAGYTQTNGLGVTNLSINNTVGGAVQVGFDYMFDKHWGVNVDVKKYILRPTYNATVNGTIPVSGTAVIDPWIIGAGVTYRF